MVEKTASPQDHDIDLEDVFSDTPEGQEPEDAKTPEVDTTYSEEEDGKGQEETPESGETAEAKKQLQDMEKRFKDTQSWGNAQNAALKKLVSRIEAGETITEDELSDLKSQNPQASEDPMKAVGEEIDRQLPILLPAYEEDGLEGKKLVENYVFLSRLDQSLQEELLALPKERWGHFVLKKGKEANEFINFLEENGKSPLEAFQKLQKQVSDLKEAKQVATPAQKTKVRGGTDLTPKKDQDDDFNVAGMLGG